MPTKNEYNGWSNRATWNVALWINNDESLYRAKEDALKMARIQGDVERATSILESLCASFWPNGYTPDGCALEDADFAEIAQSEMES
jgi:hypothetical protein